jgi:hypothetical protein
MLVHQTTVILRRKISSATSNSTKSYVEGGTTHDSKIVIKKPKPNYVMIGIVSLVGVYVIYKAFFNKKIK